MRLPCLVVALLAAATSRALAEEPVRAAAVAERSSPEPGPDRTAELPGAGEPVAHPRVESASKRAGDAQTGPAEGRPADEENHAPRQTEPGAPGVKPYADIPPTARKVEAPASAPATLPKHPRVRAADALPEGRLPSDVRGSGPDSLPLVAHELYTALLAKNVDRLAALSRAPFYFESRVASSPEEIKKRWASALSIQPLERLRLYDIDVLSPEEMVKKHGKPPERLSGWPLSGSTVTIGNFSGHAAVVLWRKSGNAWQAIAFHD